MAWVESKGSGFRVRHRNSDGTIDTESGFTTRTAARKRANQINAALTEPTGQHTETEHGDEQTRQIAPLPQPASNVPPAPHRAPQTIAPVFGPSTAAGRRPQRREPSPCPTLQQWTLTWAADHTVAPTTAAKYDSLLRQHILPAFGQLPLDEITRAAVKAWGNALHARMASSSADSIMALLSTILGEAAANRLIPTNPCLALRLARTSPAERKHATPLQILQIAARMDPMSATLVITGAYTGMRWGELAGLAWNSVLLDQDIPAIRIPKEEGALHEIGGKLWLDAPKTDSAVRTIALPPFLATLLTATRERTRTDFVFTAERGGWLRRSNFRRRTWDPALTGNPAHLDPARRDPIVPGMTFHGLRHSHKTWMKEDGIDTFVQDKRLGHATHSIGDRYTHLTPAMIQPLLTALEQRYHTSTAHFATLPRTTGHQAA